MQRPLHDNVWLLFPEGDRTIDGVLVPKEDEDSWMDALVVAAGPEVPAALEVGVGDTVIANVFDGMPLSVEGVPLRAVPADRLLAAVALPTARQPSSGSPRRACRGSRAGSRRS